MFPRKKWLVLLVVVFPVLLVSGCRKEKEQQKKPARRQVQKRVDARAIRACESAVTAYLDAVAAKDFKKALDSIDLEQMVREASEKPASVAASSPSNAGQMKEQLLLMLEKMPQDKGKLTYKILGSEVSGDEATVEVELYRDGTVSDKEAYALVKTPDGWKLRGSAIRALLPPMKPALPRNAAP